MAILLLLSLPLLLLLLLLPPPLLLLLLLLLLLPLSLLILLPLGLFWGRNVVLVELSVPVATCLRRIAILLCLRFSCFAHFSAVAAIAGIACSRRGLNILQPKCTFALLG